MGSEQVQVEVMSGDRLVDGPLLRPVRLMPGGRAGVVYGGQVYPLYAGDRVDVTDMAVDKLDCPEFVSLGGSVPYAQRTPSNRVEPVELRGLLDEDDWHLESNRFGHYLVFDATEEDAERVVACVDESPLGVRRWDASHRPADNGRLYDWFVRLQFDGDREDCLRHVRALLSPRSQFQSPAIALDESVPEHLRSAIVSALQKSLRVAQENRRLCDELATAEDRLSGLEMARAILLSESEQARIDHENKARLQAAQIQALLKAAVDREKEYRRSVEDLRKAHVVELAGLRAQVESPRLSSQPEAESETREFLQRQLDAKQQEIDQLYESWDNEATRANQLQAQLESVTVDHATACEKVTSLEEAVRSRTSQLTEVLDEQRERRTAEREKSQSKVRPNLERFLSKLFKRCVLDRESADTLLEFERPAKAVREIMRIDDDDPQLKAVAKKVKGYDRWWELSNVHTGASGKSAMGRIYFRPHDGDVIVVVHRKKDGDEQRRFMERRLVVV